MIKYPVKKNQFEFRMRQFNENPIMLKIPALAVFQMKIVLDAYYGSRRRAAFAMLREALWLWVNSKWHTILLWICDRAGWTKIYDVPETDQIRGHQQRHGRKCSGSPNCENFNCIEDSLPTWFKFITRWEK